MTIHYGDLKVNEHMLFDLPMAEGIGSILHDVAKPSRLVTMVNGPTWAALASKLMTLNLNGTDQYAQCLNADSGDLGFTTGDYTILGVIDWTILDTSQILIARYELSIGGWELYLTEAAGIYYLSIRHHHAGGATVRTARYSVGWTPGTRWVFGVSRIGGVATFFRQGEPVETLGDILIDPETTTRDLVIGTRFTKDTNFYKNTFYRPRIAGVAFTTAQHKTVYELIKEWL